VPAGGSVLYRIPVPPEATRMKWSATHPTSVQMRLEQGTLPGTTGNQHWTSSGSANVSFNQSFISSNWPWLVSQNYYLRVLNNSASPQNVVLTMNGKNAATEDEDTDGLPDAWERQYFGSTTHSGTSDPDGDGVTNAVELADGTLPNDVNSAKYFLTLSHYNGTAAKAPDQPKYDRGTTVTLTNTPTGGHTFLGWQRVGSYADDFVMRITGTVTIPADGTYTFGTSAADGLRLKINDVTVITDNTTHSVSDRFGQITLTAGSYPLVLEAFEYSGGEASELFAAPGNHASFNSNFKLLGDTTNGGLVVQTTSGAATVPGLTVQQIIGVGTGNIYNFTRMDELLPGTRAKRAETTLIAQTINFIGSGSSEGRFSGNANFPLQQPEATNPYEIGMFGDYSVAAMNSLPLADAVDAPELTFTQAGEAPWLGGLSALV
jgi:plastocyanin